MSLLKVALSSTQITITVGQGHHRVAMPDTFAANEKWQDIL